MDSIQSIILGIVQGLTEFLPVSSSGHLVMAATILEVVTPGVFVEVALHVGTLVSVLIVYRKRVSALISGALRREPAAWRYIGLLLLASVPAGLAGVFLKDWIEQAFGAPWITGVLLIVTGFILWSTRRVARTQPLRVADGGQPAALSAASGSEISNVTAATTIDWKVALGIGLAQAFAILPGISRSGSTITAGIWAGVAGEDAAEFSFLMSIIVITGAALLELRHLSSVVQGVGAVPLISGFVAALVTGIIAIQSLVWLLRRQAFYVFSFYVWAAGAGFLLYLAVKG